MNETSKKNGVFIESNGWKVELIRYELHGEQLEIKGHYVTSPDNNWPYFIPCVMISGYTPGAEPPSANAVWLDEYSLKTHLDGGMDEVTKLGFFTGRAVTRGRFIYPEFIFDESVIAQMLNCAERDEREQAK